MNPNFTRMAKAAASTLNAEKRKLEAETEAIRADYERQLIEKAADDWFRCLAVSGIVFREITGSNQKTERFLARLAEVLQQTKDDEISTADLAEELERVTGIQLEVQE